METGRGSSLGWRGNHLPRSWSGAAHAMPGCLGRCRAVSFDTFSCRKGCLNRIEVLSRDITKGKNLIAIQDSRLEFVISCGESHNLELLLIADGGLNRWVFCKDPRGESIGRIGSKGICIGEEGFQVAGLCMECLPDSL